MRTHTTVKGFCLCHLLCVWRVAGRLGIYLGFYNLCYAESERFEWGEQLFVHIMGVANAIGSLAYLWLSQGWVYDQLIFLLFVPLYIYFVRLRRHLTELLNACCQIHDTLQRCLGNWMCVPLWRECVLTLLLPGELFALFAWQCHMYYSYQACFIAGVGLIYHMQLLFLGNYLTWLASIYRALNAFLQQHLTSCHMGVLRTVLREQRSIWNLHWRIIRYFALPLLSFVCLIALRFGQLLLVWRTASAPRLDRMWLMHMLLLLLPLATLLVSSYDLQQQHRRFVANYMRLEDRVEYFKLRTWRLLRHQTLPMPFGLPIQRRFNRPQHKRDIISMLFASNLPATALCQNPLPLLVLGVHSHQLQLTLPMLLPSCMRALCLALLALCLYSLQLSPSRIYFYNSYTMGDFDINVTHTISQVYRWYFLDEFELLYCLFKLQCLLLDGVGLLKLRFDRAQQRYRRRYGCCNTFTSYLPGTLLILFNVVQLLILYQVEEYNASVNDVADGERPELDVVDFVGQFLQNVSYVCIIIRCWAKKQQLWFMVDQAQLAYKHLQSLLRGNFHLSCSWLLLLLGLLQMLMLLLFSIKLIWLDCPHVFDDNFISYLMGAMHLFLALLLSVQLFQHLLHTALLQSLNQLLQQLHLPLPRELELLRQVLHVQPLLHRIQGLAASFFSEAFGWLFLLLCLKCGSFVWQLRYDETAVLQRHKSADDLEDEAEWFHQPLQLTRDQMVCLAAQELIWPLSMMLPLLYAANLQQRQQRKLIRNIWHIQLGSRQQAAAPRAFSSSSRSRASPSLCLKHSHSVPAKDIVSFLLGTRVPLADYRTHSLTFLAWKPKSSVALVRWAGIAGGVRMLLQVAVGSKMVDFVQQLELDQVERYLKQGRN